MMKIAMKRMGDTHIIISRIALHWNLSEGTVLANILNLFDSLNKSDVAA